MRLDAFFGEKDERVRLPSHDLNGPPKSVTEWTKILAANTVHLARLLKREGCPGRG